MKLEEMNDDVMYVFVAPDGSPQTMTLAPDYATCIGVTELMAQNGICKKPALMFKQGFEILRVKVTMKQFGDAEAAFESAKRRYGG